MECFIFSKWFYTIYWISYLFLSCTSSGTSTTFSHRNQSVSFGLSRSGPSFFLFSQCLWSLFPEHRQGTWLPLCGSGKERRARLVFPPSRREMLLWMSTDGCSPERSCLLKLTIATSSVRLLVGLFYQWLSRPFCCNVCDFMVTEQVLAKIATLRKQKPVPLIDWVLYLMYLPSLLADILWTE